MPKLNGELLRFAIAGVAGLGIDVVVLYLALAAGSGWYVGRAMSFFSAVFLTWQINRRYTFAAARGSPWREWWRYLLAMSGGGLVNYAVYSMVVTLLPDAPYLPLLAVAIGSVAGMGINFVSAKWFVFQP